MQCHALKVFDHDRPTLLQLASDNWDLTLSKKYPEEEGQTPKGGRWQLIPAPFNPTEYRLLVGPYGVMSKSSSAGFIY